MHVMPKWKAIFVKDTMLTKPDERTQVQRHVVSSHAYPFGTFAGQWRGYRRLNVDVTSGPAENKIAVLETMLDAVHRLNHLSLLKLSLDAVHPS